MAQDEIVPAEQQQAAPLATPTDGVRAFDQFGNEVIVPREEWRTNVLPNMLQEVYDQPEQLYMLIVNSLNDGFVAEVTEAAAHLYEIDPMPARGASVWAVVLVNTARADEAETVLTRYLTEHGEDSSVLINLAKVYAAQGNQEKADATLWRGLELDPNQDNGLGWYTTMAQETGGEDGARAGLERVRALDGSWRAQLWLARGELAVGNVPAAVTLYEEALNRAPLPIPQDLLMQMSGDLGGRGLLNELVQFTTPHFVPEVHGLPVGMNLIKANADLGNIAEAGRIKDLLQAFNVPEWKGALDFWDGDLARRRVGATNGTPGLPQAPQIQIGMLRVDGPIWLPAGSPVGSVFGIKPEGPSVTFLGGSAETPESPTEAEMQLSDALGRMTRALPLYLAEQVQMRTAAHGRAMIPWAVARPESGQPGGFVVSGQRWPDETAIQAVQDPANQSDYVVTVHVDAEVEPWEASLVFVRASDGTRIGELQADFTAGAPEQGIPGLADEMVELLSALGTAQAPAAYEIPTDANFNQYLLRLEQLLAVRCAAMDGVGVQFLQGEREILDGNLALCQAEPASMPARILLVETMGALGRVKPEPVQAFLEDFNKLQQEHPLPQLDEAFGVERA